MKRIFLVFCLTLILNACGAKDKVFNLEKEGLIYNYSEKVNFYHPRDWEVSEDTIKLSVDILNPDAKEGLYFDAFVVQSQNAKDELLDLYLTQLMNLGITIENIETLQLESSQKCTLVEGFNELDDICFSEVIVFIGEKQYVYSYIANENVYKDHVDQMKTYLMSLVVNEM